MISNWKEKIIEHIYANRFIYLAGKASIGRNQRKSRQQHVAYDVFQAATENKDCQYTFEYRIDADKPIFSNVMI